MNRGIVASKIYFIWDKILYFKTQPQTNTNIIHFYPILQMRPIFVKIFFISRILLLNPISL